VIHHGDLFDVLPTLEAESVQCCVTSPPYWGLRDYEHPAQLGLEKTPDLYVERMVSVFREVKRVLRKDGTFWLNIGDTFQNAKGQAHGIDPKQPARRHGLRPQDVTIKGLKAKDLVGIPWLLAFALRADGWYLRSEIIWSKPNPMPESVTDRPTRAHEQLFLLTKSARYHYDAASIRQPYAASTLTQFERLYEGEGTKDYVAAGVQNPSDIKRRITDKQRGHSRRHAGFNDRWDAMPKVEQQMGGANKRSVWTISTQPTPEAHFATFPEALVEPCIRAGCPQGGTVLDPFAGSGTVGVVCAKLQRRFIGIELNADYVAIALRRVAAVAPLFAAGLT
jgi:DNA modification methylase